MSPSARASRPVEEETKLLIFLALNLVQEDNELGGALCSGCRPQMLVTLTWWDAFETTGNGIESLSA